MTSAGAAECGERPRAAGAPRLVLELLQQRAGLVAVARQRERLDCVGQGGDGAGVCEPHLPEQARRRRELRGGRRRVPLR